MRGQRGFTVLELLVVTVIIGLISLPLTTLAIKGLTSYNFLDMQSNTSAELAILSGKITSVVRSATSVDTAQGGTLIVYAYKTKTDTVVSKYRYFISGNTLSLGITPASGSAPNYTYSSGSEVVKVLRTDMAMGSSSIFSYYDTSGAQLSDTFGANEVRQIGVLLTANPNPKLMATPVTITTQVTIRNLMSTL